MIEILKSYSIGEIATIHGQAQGKNWSAQVRVSRLTEQSTSIKVVFGTKVPGDLRAKITAEAVSHALQGLELEK